MPDHQNNLTEKQKKNMQEFLAVTLSFGEEELAAIDHQVPMTPELFERCMDACISVHAVNQLDRLMTEFPEFVNAYLGRVDSLAAETTDLPCQSPEEVTGKFQEFLEKLRDTDR